MSALRSPIQSALRTAVRAVICPPLVGGSVFDPSDWFVNGEEGLFYNFNNMGVSDLVLGPEVNPVPEFDATGGWFVGSSMTIAGGSLNALNTWALGQSSFFAGLVRGKTYFVEATVTNWVGTGQFSIGMGNNPSADGALAITGNGTYRAVLRCDTASAPDRLAVGNNAAAGYSFSITRLSCKEVISGFLPTMLQATTGIPRFVSVPDRHSIGFTEDLSQRRAVGPNIITNSDFSSPAAWILEAGIDISGGTLNFTNSNGTSARQAAGPVNTYYEAEFDLLSISQGGMRMSIGNVFSPTYTSPGHYKLRVLSGGNNFMRLWADGLTTAVCDNFTVREVPGNHATQPTAAARPLFGVVDGAMGAVFDAVDDRLTATVPMTGNEFTSVMLVKRNGSPTRFLFDYSTGDTGNGLYYLGTNPYVPVWWTGAGAFEPNGANFLQGDFDAITTAHDGVQGYHRKGLQALIPVPTAFAPNSGNTAVLGMSRSFTLPADASIVMWVLVDKYKTPAEQDQLVTWMLQQAGLLP